MTQSVATRFNSPEFRTAVYYFTSFTSVGAAVAYAGIWFTQQGLSAGDVGVINAVPVLIMLGLNLLVGRLADKAKDWRQVIVIGALMTAVIPLALFFVHGFIGILIVWTCCAVPIAAIAPVVDAAALRMTKRNGSDFGTLRGSGTVGYMTFNAVTGLVAGIFGPMVFVPLYALLNAARGAASLWLPNFRAPPREDEPPGGPAGAKAMGEVMKPWFLLPLLAFSAVQATHLILNSFSALLWSRQGIPPEVVGPLIALGAFAEALTMFAWRRIGGRFSARTMLLISALASTVRWSAMALSPPVWVLIFLQLLQSLTFAVGYLGSVHFIAKWTSEDIAAEVQSFFVVLQQAISVVAVAGFGWLVGGFGAHAFFAAAAVALMGAGFVWLSMRMKQPV